VVAGYTLGICLATGTSSNVGAHHWSLHKISAPLNVIQIGYSANPLIIIISSNYMIVMKIDLAKDLVPQLVSMRSQSICPTMGHLLLLIEVTGL
jgi:hypothetical protein